MKACSKCGIDIDKVKGGYCNSCKAEYLKKYREEHKDSLKEKRREYESRSEVREKSRMHSKKYYEENKDRIKEKFREQNRDKKNEHTRNWRKTEAGRESQKRRKKKVLSTEEGRIKARAVSSVNRAINRCDLIRSSCCDICNKKTNTEAHHYNGYENENELKVIFICQRCHVAVHKALNRLCKE